MKLRLTYNINSDEEFIDKIIRRYHFEDKDREDLERVYGEVKNVISPCALYRINQWITKVKEIDDNQAALVAITLGKGTDILYERYTEEGKLNEAYMSECMANEILLGLYEEFNKSYSRIHRRYVSGYIFVGDEIPLKKIRELLVKLQEKNIENMEIKANEYGVMVPSKSVLFYAILSDNPKHACVGICEGCSSHNCSYRKQDNDTKLNYGYQRIFSTKEG